MVKDWGAPVAHGSFDEASSGETIRLARPVQARYLKFVMLNEQYGRSFASVAELEVELVKQVARH